MARLDRTFGNLYTLLRWPFRQLSEPKVNLGNVLGGRRERLRENISMISHNIGNGQTQQT